MCGHIINYYIHLWWSIKWGSTTEDFNSAFNLVTITAWCVVVGTIKVSNVHPTLQVWRAHAEKCTHTQTAGLPTDENIGTCRNWHTGSTRKLGRFILLRTNPQSKVQLVHERVTDVVHTWKCDWEREAERLQGRSQDLEKGGGWMVCAKCVKNF